MAASLVLIVLLLGYLAFAALFLASPWSAPRLTKYFGLATVAAAAPLFFWAGVFSEQFSAGQCYSKVVGMIASSVEGTSAPSELSKLLRALPMHGYETVCSEVEAAVRKLPNPAPP